MIKISKPSKMKIIGKRVGCWSLEARKSCPGSKTSDGTVVEVCQNCYATKGMYRFPVVKAARQTNHEDYHKADWTDRMVAKISKFDYFRWFDSGDLETPELATKVLQVISFTPNVTHWLPTRSFKIPAIHSIIQRIKELPNVAVRYSADNIGLSKLERPGVNSYVINITDIPEATKRGIYICPVTAHSGQKSCESCTMCYTNTPVAYVLH